MLERLVCLIRGHKWGRTYKRKKEPGFIFKRCARCGKIESQRIPLLSEKIYAKELIERCSSDSLVNQSNSDATTAISKLQSIAIITEVDGNMTTPTGENKE